MGDSVTEGDRRRHGGEAEEDKKPNKEPNAAFTSVCIRDVKNFLVRASLERQRKATTRHCDSGDGLYGEGGLCSSETTTADRDSAGDTPNPVVSLTPTAVGIASSPTPGETKLHKVWRRSPTGFLSLPPREPGQFRGLPKPTSKAKTGKVRSRYADRKPRCGL